MQKSILSKGILCFLGLAGAASAQKFMYWDPADTSKTPKLISQTGLYKNLAVNKEMVPEAQLFEVNSPLWSDGSIKKRWVIGKGIGYKDKDDYWNYPDSTVFVKEFAIDTIEGNPASRILWETRFLMLKKQPEDPTVPNSRLVDVWYGYSYKWRANQMDADLVSIEDGLNAAVKTYPNGLGQPAVMKKWVFPSSGKCMECHRTETADTLHGRSVLGFFTAQLNMPSPTNAAINQLTDLANKGILVGVPTNLANSPKWYGIESTDPNATLEKKARAYIAANCSGCHGDRGMNVGATFGVSLNYDYHSGVERMKFEYMPVSWSYDLDTLPPADDPVAPVTLVTPGYPQKSVILYRQTARNTVAYPDIAAFDPERNQMPPLATFEVNEKAMKVINDWIAGLQPDSNVSIRAHARQGLKSPYIQGRNLHLPKSMLNGALPKVSMTGVNGRTVDLYSVGSGVYAIPVTMPKGIYIVRVGSQRFTRYLF